MIEKKILVTKSSLPDYSDYCAKIKTIWDSAWLTNCGPLHNEFEEKLVKYLGVNAVSLYTNGHLALENALKLLDLEGEIITTPFTFVSTTNAIVRTGNTPVFCDINPVDFTIDVNKIEELITDKTVAIVPVHVYGNVCNVDAISEIAKRHNLKVVYDAAHAFGVKYHGASIARCGDVSMFSFHATKVFNTIEGGALAYNDLKLKQKAEALKNFGILNYENIEYIGGNAKMNEFQAAMGICNLENLDRMIERRRKVVEKYRKLLSSIDGIKMNAIQNGVESNYAYFPILVEDDYGLTRDELFELLYDNNICARKYFYPANNDLMPYSGYRGKTPIARQISEKVLTLPLYPGLNLKIVEQICKIIRKAGKK